MTGSSSSEHDTKLTLKAESSACVSGDTNSSCTSLECSTLNLGLHVKSTERENKALVPLCH